MEVTLTSDQQALARAAMAEGRLHSETEAVAQALVLWEDRERQRISFIATLIDAQSPLDRGEGRELTMEFLPQLTASIKERGRTRFACELSRLV